jgi:CRP-like cAMP-binding protein
MTDDNLKQIAKDLRIVEEFGDLPDDELLWLANHVEERTFSPGEELSKEGDPANEFIVNGWITPISTRF